MQPEEKHGEDVEMADEGRESGEILPGDEEEAQIQQKNAPEQLPPIPVVKLKNKHLEEEKKEGGPQEEASFVPASSMVSPKAFAKPSADGDPLSKLTMSTKPSLLQPSQFTQIPAMSQRDSSVEIVSQRNGKAPRGRG